MTAKRRGRASTMGKATRLMEAAMLIEHRREAWEAQGRCCKYCLEPLKFHDSTSDHKVPRSQGGLSVRDNIVCSCGPCNTAKSSMSYKDFTAILKAKAPSGHVAKMLAWSRRRIWLATYRAQRNICYSVGLPNPTPVGMRP